MTDTEFVGISGNRVVLDPTFVPDDLSVLKEAAPDAREIMLRNLLSQGIHPGQLQQVLAPGPESIPPPFTLRDSKPGANAFIDAMDTLAPDRKIAIWGDYDVDGNTSSTILGTLARQLRPDAVENIRHYIPRREEGYGLNIPGIDTLAHEGVKTLFVVDIGTTAYKEIAHARKLGMEVVVIDHHQPKPGEKLPEGAFIINPHRLDEELPQLKSLSAAGLSWLFARDVKQALRDRGEEAKAAVIDDGLMTVAACLGTIADVVPLQSPLNRYIIEQGLKEMESSHYPGIEALKGLFGIHKIKDSDVGFSIGPAINAAGRLDDPTVGMRMLLAKNQEDAERLAKELTAYNDERKQFSNQIIFPAALRQSKQVIAGNPDTPVLMLNDDHWAGGVVGIVASRIKDEYGVPAFVGSQYKGKDGHDYITYSARSIEGVDLYHTLFEAFKTLPEKDVLKFGGHAMAAGLTIRAEAKERVLEVISAALKEPVRQARLSQSTRVAGEMKPEDITLDTIESLYKYGAYGARITAPRILVRNVQVKQVRAMGDGEEHLSVSLGANGRAGPFEVLRYGTAFRSRDTKLGALLRDSNRHNHEIDVVIEPYVFEKKTGEMAVGYHLLDASPARIVGHDPDSQDVLEAHLAKIHQAEDNRKAETAKIRSLPLKIEDLLEGNSPQAQAVLKQLYDAKISLLDTETTGLNAGHPDHARTNGLTQIAVSKVIKTGSNGTAHYALEEKVFTILPVTPAYYEYHQAVKNAKKQKLPLPAYDKARYEYAISQQALDVTGTEFIRSSENGPITEMRVGGKKVDARPFYEVAGDVAAFLSGTKPYAFNMPFDARVMAKHLGDVLAAGEAHWEEPQLNIRDGQPHEAYRKMTEPLSHVLEKDEAAPVSFMRSLSDPLNYSCVMHAGLLEQGERAFNRLDDMATRYLVAFERDPNAHDAREDIRPLAYMIAAQLHAFGRQESKRLVSPELAERFPGISGQLEEELRSEGYDMQGLWHKLARHSDPAATAEVGTTEVVKAKKKETWQHLKLTFPSAAKGSDLPGIGQYLESLVPAQERNNRIPKLVLAANDNSVSLSAIAKATGDIPLFSSFKKANCVDRLYREAIAVKVKAFDSTSTVDITLAGVGGATPVTVENVPLSGLRKSLDFLLSEQARPHIREYLELLRWINELPQAGLATYDEKGTGITIRGLQREFGGLKIAVPQGKTLIDVIPEIKKHAHDLLAIATVPGARSTDYNIDEDESEEIKSSKAKDLLFETAYKLDKAGSMLMAVSVPLIKLVAQEKGFRLDGDHFTWPGGIVGQKAEDGESYLLHGTLETFGEIGSDIRNAAWLLYRLNNLPGVHMRKTSLDEGKLTLGFAGPVPQETLWILHRAHVPFKASRDAIEISMPELMNDPFHWYWEIRKDQEYVKNELEKKKPEKPPLFLQALSDRLREGAISNFEIDRGGKAFASVDCYPLVPVNSNVTETDDLQHGLEKHLLNNPLFDSPDLAGIKHRGLAVRLSQLHGVQKNYSHLSRAEDGRCVLTTPGLDPLDNRRMLIDNFRDICRLARSAHINPLLDNLRDIVTSSDMEPDHNEPYQSLSPETLARIQHLDDKIQKLMPHLAILTKEVEAFETNFGNVRLKDIIFRNVAELTLIEKTLSEAHAKGQLPVDSEQEYKAMQAALKGYYESLSMAEFKRYRLTLDGLQVIKSIERIKKVLEKQPEKIASDPLYGPYLAHKELSSALEKLWDDSKRYKRTLHFSDEIIACSASLSDQGKLREVNKAVELTYRHQHMEVEEMLSKIRAEGGIGNFEEDGNHWIFNSATLEKSPEYWDARIAELQQGKQAIPAVPHMVIDTSSLLTLLLGKEQIPGDKQAGYLGLVQDLARQNAIIPVITGAVLAEFLNSPVPLTPRDIFTLDESGKATGILYTDENRRHLRFRNGHKSEVEYPKWHQRLEFLMDLYNNGRGTFIETPTESLYFDAIRAHEKLQHCFEKIAKEYPDQLRCVHGKTNLRDLTNDELKAFLLTPQESRQQFMHQMRSAGVRKDIGEVSLADAVQAIHNRFGQQAPVFILYEGNDVRSRLLMRKVRASHGQDSYMAGKDATLTADFKPGHSKFDARHTTALGNTHFLSTMGFLSGLMKSAKTHEVFVIAPEEHNHGIPADMDNPPQDSYPGMGRKLRDHAGRALKGYERSYSKLVDEPASELGQSSMHSKSFMQGKPGPWQQQLDTLPAQTLRDIFANHLIREREFKQDKLVHHGDKSKEAIQDIMEIERRLTRLANINRLPIEKKTELPPAPAIILNASAADPRAAQLAQRILEEHEAMLDNYGPNRKIGIRPRLPEAIRFEIQRIPAQQRSAVVAEIASMLRRSLSGSAEGEVYAAEYSTMLGSLNPASQRYQNRG